MSSIAIVLRTEKKLKSGLYPVVVRVTEGTKRRELTTGYRIATDHWDAAASQVKKSHPDYIMINAAIEMKRAEVSRSILEASLSGKAITLDDLGVKRRVSSFTQYLRTRAADYGERGMEVMKNRVEGQYINDLISFHGGEVYFEDITVDWARKYDAHMIRKGNGANYRSKKIRTLRDWYDDAIVEGKAKGPNALAQYSISTVPVHREKLKMDQVQAIAALELKGNMAVTRDMWLFSFYCRGMRFQNVLLLPVSGIRDGRVYWEPNKSGGFASAPIHGRLAEIIATYYTEGMPFLFKWVKTVPETPYRERKVCDMWNVTANKHLKVIAALAGIKANLTFHVARHTFAFALKNQTDNIHVIKDALVHKDSRTTEMYLKSLDDERLDKEVGKVYEY